MAQIGDTVDWLKSAKWGGKDVKPVIFLGYVGKKGKYVAVRDGDIERRVAVKNIRQLRQDTE